MKCAVCNVNFARYIMSDGRLTCAICSLAVGLDSIRLSDVPQLLAWARKYVAANFPLGVEPVSELRAIIGKGTGT